MPETYPHLPLVREQPVNPRRAPSVRFRVPEPPDWRAFGAGLRRRLQAARVAAAQDIGGFDERRLIKLEMSTPLDPAALQRISPEIEIVSQEERSVVVAFATEAALAAFEARFTTRAEGRQPIYRNVLFALKGFDRCTGGLLDDEPHSRAAARTETFRRGHANRRELGPGTYADGGVIRTGCHPA